MPAVGVELRGEYPTGALLGLEYHRARAVAEQHTGGAILPVEDAAEGFRTDHERVIGGAAADHAFRHRQSVEETGAHRLDIEGNAIIDAEGRLNDRRRGREGLVRCRGGEHDEPD